MPRTDPVGAGLTLGLLAGAGHAAWIALVAFTTAPWVGDVVFRGQIIRATFELDGVDLSLAAFLVLVSALVGCSAGWLTATIWNGFATLFQAVPFQQADR